MIFRAGMNYLTVVIRQYFLLSSLVYFLVWIITMVWGNFLAAWVFLTEAIEWRISACACTIESPLYGYDTTQRIVFHIITENHQLGYIDEATELLIRETLFVHPCAFCQHTTMIIWFFYFYKAKRQSVYKQGDVWSELILTILAGKLSCKMESIVFDIVKVNQFYRRYGFKAVVKTTTEVIIVQLFANVSQYLEIFSLMSWIQFFELLLKNRQKDICVTVIDRAILLFAQLAKVSISYSSKMNHCRHLYPCCFRELLHFTYPFYRLSNPLNPLVVSPLSVARFPN